MAKCSQCGLDLAACLCVPTAAELRDGMRTRVGELEAEVARLTAERDRAREIAGTTLAALVRVVEAAKPFAKWADCELGDPCPVCPEPTAFGDVFPTVGDCRRLAVVLAEVPT